MFHTSVERTVVHLNFSIQQECLEFTLLPELLAVLLYVEALEDNEVVFVENVRQFNRILTDSSKQPFLENLKKPKKVVIKYEYTFFENLFF